MFVPQNGRSVRQRVLQFLLAGALLAGIVVLIIDYSRGRIAEFDQWKTTGFSTYQFHRGALCFFQLRDAHGEIAAERVISFQNRMARILPTDQAEDTAPPDWVWDCRTKIAALRESRGLDNPLYLDQSMCSVRDGSIYYGVTPAQEFTKVVHFPERTCLLFTSGGSRELRTMQSERWVFIFPAFLGPVVGIELSRPPEGKLACEFRKFKNLNEVHQVLNDRYSYTNFDVIEKRLNIWPGKP